MRILATAALFALLALRGCVTYEFDHEFWLNVNGSGQVNVTGRPELWAVFKGLKASPSDAEALRSEARRLFEASGLEVRRVTLTRRGGHPYLFVAARFRDINALRGTAAFPDLDRLGLAREPERLRVHGIWKRPPAASSPSTTIEGLVAVRFHLTSKVYEHRNAVDGLERGNIVSWRETVAESLKDRPLEFGFLAGDSSILFSTVGLFVAAIVMGLSFLALALYLTARKGRRQTG